MTLWSGLVAGPWFIFLAPITPGSAYTTLGASGLVVALVSYWQLYTNRLRPGVIATVAAGLMALHLPFFPTADAVAHAIPFGVAAVGVLASPFVSRRAFPWYVGYMGIAYMSQMYWRPARTHTVISLSVEVALVSLISLSLRSMAGSSAESDQRYRHLFERVPTSIWLEDFSAVALILEDWRTAGVEDLEAFLSDNPSEFERAIAAIQVTDVNPATVQLVGAEDREAMIGSLDPRTIIEDTRESFVAILKAIYEGRDTARTEVTGRKIDGSDLHGSLRLLVPRTPAGQLNLREIVVSITDVSDLKAAQRNLERAKNEAETAHAIKSEFLANMSHEIRTPMNAILGMTELALVTELTPEQREYLGTTKSSVDALLKLVNDILDFSKIEAGKLELDSVPFSVRDSIGDTIRTLGVKAAEKGLSLTHSFVGEVPDGLQGDPGRLRQVLINLVANALKFTHVGGVTVSVAAEDTTDGQTRLHFSVADTGIGIAPDQQTAIFEMFAQADGSSTRDYGGTGLGLTISAQLVERMGGEIWVDSEVGKGSTFHFTAEFGIVDDAKVSLPTIDLTQTRVMTIADTATQRTIVEVLRQGGMQPQVVTDASTALQMLADTSFAARPEAILYELSDAHSQARELAATGIPVIVVAEPGRRGDAASLAAVGVTGYLTKPVSNSDLVDMIRAVIAGSGGDTLITRHWLREHRRTFHVLLADDSPTNRMLAMRLLENRGHQVTPVSDGAEAVAAFEESSYDVILMDVQMPVLDGFEATAAIRRLEADAERQTPIIALTAHAMDGDRQRCLDKGMDAYVSKPFRSAELIATIEQLVGADGGATLHLIEDDDYSNAGPAIDRRQLMESVSGMTDVMAEIIGLVIEEIPPLAADIPPAVEAGDFETVAKRAHRIKGSMGSIAARRAYAAAGDLEVAANAGDAADVAVAWDQLTRELKFVEAELQELANPTMA